MQIVCITLCKNLRTVHLTAQHIKTLQLTHLDSLDKLLCDHPLVHDANVDVTSCPQLKTMPLFGLFLNLLPSSGYKLHELAFMRPRQFRDGYEHDGIFRVRWMYQLDGVAGVSYVTTVKDQMQYIDKYTAVMIKRCDQLVELCMRQVVLALRRRHDLPRLSTELLIVIRQFVRWMYQ